MDAVIVWEGLSDPEYRLKRARYLAGSPEKVSSGKKKTPKAPDNLGFCLASILKNALFIRRIFIISPIEEIRPVRTIRETFPDSEVEIIVLTHEDLYLSRKGRLPIFNPDAAGLMAPLITGLGEDFIFLKPDSLFTSPCNIGDFLKDGVPVLHDSSKKRVPPAFMERFRKTRDRERQVAINSAKMVRSSHYFTPSPVPVLIKKSACLELFEQYPDVRKKYACKRFPSESDLSLPSLFYAASSGDGVILRNLGETLVVSRGDDDKIVSGLRTMREVPNIRFCKIPDLGSLTFYTRHAVTDWVSERLGLRL